MGHLRKPRPITPIVTLLSGRAEWLDATLPRLEEFLGPVDLRSDDFPFDGTKYYATTMGPNIKRRFYTFQELRDPSELADWKLKANDLEEALAKEFRAADPSAPERPVNIDPGCLNGSKFILASTKDFAHRIYLRDGIFAEITLGYREDKWEHYYFTFPDFRTGLYNEFLTLARQKHLEKKSGREER
jgi:hypothetical protein